MAMLPGLLPETLHAGSHLPTLVKANVVIGVHCDVSIDPFKPHDAASRLA